MPDYKTLSAFEKIELQKQLAAVTSERDKERALNDKLVESYEKADFEIRKLKAEREQMEKQELERSSAYDSIDRFLRNNLDDADYVMYSQSLETVYAHPPVPDGKVLADAERYRWLRDKALEVTDGQIFIGVDGVLAMNKWALTADEANVVIDEAMLKAAQGE